MKKALSFLTVCLLAVCVILTCCACANADADGGDFYGDGSYSGGSGALKSETVPSADPSVGEDGEGGDGGESKEPVSIPAGQITAAEWCDLENYGYWLSLIASGQTEEENGVFYSIANSDYYSKIDTTNMFKVTVTCGEERVSGAAVELKTSESTVFCGVTNAKGIAYIFGAAASGTVGVKSGDYATETPYSGTDISVNLDGCASKAASIELMFVVDTTGSMGDELEYLKVEIDDVIGRVKTANEGVDIKIALLFYRDTGDEYVTRYFDFNADIAAQKTNLKAQASSGGGDYEEAVDTALSEAVSKQWSSGTSTKIIFHVLDAPPHPTEENIGRYNDCIIAAAAKGIRIIPVASSGVDKATEFLLRSAAIISGGTYVFITDDSGIGGEHLEASVGDYTVELLNSLMVRLVNEYYTGTDITPIPWEQE